MNSSTRRDIASPSPSIATTKPVPITPERFFTAWCAECAHQKDNLLGSWERTPNYTNAIMRNCPPGSVIEGVATRLGREAYCEYYGLDAVLFQGDDRVYCAPAGETWLQNIDIAFEHENHFRSGVFQEASHLLVTRCNLRVLVTYPEAYDERPELECLKRVIGAAKLPDPGFLLITGRRIDRKIDGTWGDIHWRGQAYTATGGWLAVTSTALSL